MGKRNKNNKKAKKPADEPIFGESVSRETDPDLEGQTVHVLTEEDFENNPELKKTGLIVGDEVLIPGVPEEELPVLEEEEPVEETPRSTRQKKENPVLVKPSWVDQLLWDKLDDDKKLDLVNGKRSF